MTLTSRGCSPSRPAVMITDHVPAVKDHRPQHLDLRRRRPTVNQPLPEPVNLDHYRVREQARRYRTISTRRTQAL